MGVLKAADNHTPGRRMGRAIQRAGLLLCCWLACQCALRPVPRDLAVYVNRDIYGIVGLEDLGLQRYAAVTGEHYISDAVLKETLDRDILPAYKHFADLVGRIEPQTQSVQNLHALYCKAVNFRLQGFRLVLLAIDNQDPDVIRQANRMFKQGQDCIAQWRTRLAELTARYGLEFNIQ
jgi:hypothetical protein